MTEGAVSLGSATKRSSLRSVDATADGNGGYVVAELTSGGIAVRQVRAGQRPVRRFLRGDFRSAALVRRRQAKDRQQLVMVGDDGGIMLRYVEALPEAPGKADPTAKPRDSRRRTRRANETAAPAKAQDAPARRTSRQSEPVDVVIMTILREEYDAVRQHLSEPKWWSDGLNKHAWQVGHVQSQRGRYRVVLAMAATAGTNNAAMVMRNTVDTFRPPFALIVGIAGGLVSEGERTQPPASWPVRKGDVVVSSIIYGYEYGKIDKGGFQPRHDLTYQVNGSLLAAAQALPGTCADWFAAAAARPRRAPRPSRASWSPRSRPATRWWTTRRTASSVPRGKAGPRSGPWRWRAPARRDRVAHA